MCYVFPSTAPTMSYFLLYSSKFSKTSLNISLYTNKKLQNTNMQIYRQNMKISLEPKSPAYYYISEKFPTKTKVVYMHQSITFRILKTFLYFSHIVTAHILLYEYFCIWCFTKIPFLCLALIFPLRALEIVSLFPGLWNYTLIFFQCEFCHIHGLGTQRTFIFRFISINTCDFCVPF